MQARDAKVDSGNEKIHIHIFDDFLPIPTFLNIGVHDFPHLFYDFECRFDVAKIGVGFEGFESFLDSLPLML